MRPLAAALSLSVLTSSLAGCFPHNAQKRTYSQIGEGVVILGGIAILAGANTGADCQRDIAPGVTQDCKNDASLRSSLGLGLILAGLVGFIATVSSAKDDAENTPAVAPTPAPAPTVTTPPPAPPAPAPPATIAAPPGDTPPAEPTPPTPPTEPTPQ